MFSLAYWLFVLLIIAVAICAAASLIIARLLERRHPPTGAFVTVEKTRLHLVDIGPQDATQQGAPAILLLHGANLCLDDMQMALGARLAEKFRVIIPDRPGQGYSALGQPPAVSPDAQVVLIRAALRARGVARVVIVGHSLGGLIALRYALDHPQDVAGLVLVNPTSHPRPNDLPWFQRVAGALLGPVAAYTLITPLSLVTNSALTKQLFRPEAAPPDYAAQSGLALAMAPGRFLASLREYAALRDELIRHAPHYPKIAVPTTVIAGESDAIAPPAIHAEALAAALPNASLLRLAGAGHMAHHTHAFVVVRETERLAGWM